MILFTQPIIAALVASHLLLGLGIINYKMKFNDATERVEKQIEESSRWKRNAVELDSALDKQNRAISDLVSAQKLKDAQGALDVERARQETIVAQSKAKELSTRQRDRNVPACVAATNLFDEVLHGAK